MTNDSVDNSSTTPDDQTQHELDHKSPMPVTHAIVADHVGRDVDGPQGQLTILDDINLQVTRGERVAIVGVSGSGKSTLLGLLAGLDSATRGSVLLDGVDLTTLDEDGRAALRAGRVGFVFQDFQLLGSMTALENVALPLEMTQATMDVKQIREVATTMLNQVGLADRLHHYPSQLSGGEQQRVAIARAFAASPSVLFADEPTGNLDQSTAEQILDLLIKLNEERKTTMIIVTHDRQLASRCDRYLEMAGGRIILSS